MDADPFLFSGKGTGKARADVGRNLTEIGASYWTWGPLR
jgi:hypothetical protein